MTIFDFVKSKIPILDVISQYSKLKRAGIYWKGNCPFHSEKTPSFTVSPHREIFYCFGCHEGGDIVAFMAKAEGCSQIEAAKSLVEKYGLKIPESINLGHQQETSSPDEKKHYFKICEEVANWTHSCLLESSVASKYIRSRKLDESTVRKFTIGYFPPRSIKKLLSYVHKAGLVAKDLINAGILAESKNQIYSPFENRVLFPIKDHIGRFCGFGGRVFKPDDDRAKYYNSKENEHFAKGSLLFGLDIAKEEIRKKGFVFLVEGYTDCIAMYQAGYANTVATLGTSCTHEHIKILNRFASEVYVLYDGDKAGREAILRLTELCWDVSLDLKVVCLPSKEDPASFITSGKDLAPFIKNKKNIYLFFTETISHGFQTKSLDEKLKAVGKLVEMIQKVEDPIKQNILIQSAVAALNIPIESLTSKIRPTRYSSTQPISATQADKLEATIFSAVLNNLELTSSVEDLVPYFSAKIRPILKKLIELKKEGRQEFQYFYSQLTSEEQLMINQFMFKTDYDFTDNFEELLTRFQKKNWKRIATSFKQMIGNAESQEEVSSLLSRFQRLKEKMLSLN